MTQWTRRSFCSSLLATGAATHLPTAARAKDEVLLRAYQSSIQLAPSDYPETAVWAYQGLVPGPAIRAKQGERIQRRFFNELPQDSSVHWHGIRIENAMDGVVGLTQKAVPPGDEFLYDFVVPDAGTYWYHPHNRTSEQMARGLYGALIVEEADGPIDVDQDEVLLIDDWRLTDTAQIADGFDNLHDKAHGGRIGNWITVNGDGSWTRDVPHLSRLRLRLVNAANARVFGLEARGLEGWIVALDGMPLDQPQPLDQIILAPAQRADLVVDITAEEGGEALLISRERDQGYAIAVWNVVGTARSNRLSSPDPLPANIIPPLGPLDTARSAQLRMEGGAMGSMAEARLGGRMMGMRELAAEGRVWAFNGMADMDALPLMEARRGETIRISMINDTAWPHAMHLHGHHFRQIRDDGTLGPWRDTLFMRPREEVAIAFVADNPGDWLLHCHMLEHASSGMTTWLRVL